MKANLKDTTVYDDLCLFDLSIEASVSPFYIEYFLKTENLSFQSSPKNVFTRLDLKSLHIYA